MYFLSRGQGCQIVVCVSPPLTAADAAATITAVVVIVTTIMLPLSLLFFVVVRSGILMLGQLSIGLHHFPSALTHILLAAGQQ